MNRSATTASNDARAVDDTGTRRQPTADGVTSPPDTVIDAFAARQHGVVSRRQLLSAGVPAHVIDYRVRRGRLRQLHRGVYGVGPVTGRFGREMAGVLACGDSAFLSHDSAAPFWRLGARPADAAPVEVTVTAGPRRPGAGIRVHRAPGLRPDETTEVHGIPITTPARTLLDLAGRRSPRELERALAGAIRDRILSGDDVARLIRRHPRRPGTGILRDVLARDGGPAFTRSEAESRFLDLMRRSPLPAPRCNVRVRGREVDFLWAAERLVVEIDGFEFHGRRAAFERDHRRDAALTVAGYRVLRFTWAQITREETTVLVRVAQALVGGARQR